MAIVVVCPKCRARFQVSEKFAGKQGPCPKCKGLITVPQLEDQVKIHEPEQYGGAKDAKGRHVLKPIERTETQLSPVAMVAIIAGTLLTIGIAFGGRGLDDFLREWLLRIGAVVLAPPLVLAGYSFLRNQELEPYRGKELIIRTALCSVAYAALWGIFTLMKLWFLPDPTNVETWSWIYLGGPILVVGSFVAFATLDLDFGSGFFHYCFYLLSCILLRWAMGISLL